MKKLLPALFVAVLMVLHPDAEAKRMGGGKSFGQQSSNVTQRNATPPTSPTAPTQNAATAPAKPGAPAAAPAAAPKKPWGAMLGGLAAGLGLAWLAHSLGMGEGFAQFLMIALLAVAAFAVFKMVMRSRKGAAAAQGGAPFAFQGAGAGAGTPAEASMPRSYSPDKVGNDASARPWERSSMAFDATKAGTAAGGSMIGSALGGQAQTASVIPADFDVAAFVRNAKVNFIRLQAANDAGNLDDIRAFTTPEMFAEIQMDIRERNGATQETRVLDLEASVLEVAEEDAIYVVSTHFTGRVQEDGADPEDINEVWHLTKPRQGNGGWVLAGIQQNN